MKNQKLLHNRTTMMLKIYLIGVLFIYSCQLVGQDLKRHEIAAGYTGVVAERLSGENFTGHGIHLAYRYHLNERWFGFAQVGRLDYEVGGINESQLVDFVGDFRFDFAFMEFGVGYNLISRERFTVSTTLAYLRTNQVRHFKDGIAGNIVNFALNRVPNHGARVGLQTAFKLNDAISLVPELGFSPRIDRFQSFWTSLGLTYSF